MADQRLVPLFYIGVPVVGDYLVGSADNGLPIPFDTTLKEARAQTKTPLQGLVTIRIENLTKQTNTLLLLTGDRTTIFHEYLFGQYLPFEKNDRLRALIVSVDSPEETGRDLTLYLTFE